MSDEVKVEVAPTEATQPETPVVEQPVKADKAAKYLELEQKFLENRIAKPEEAKPEVKVEEKPAEPVKVEKKEEDDFTRRFAALSKMEREIKRKQDEIKANESEIAEARKYKDLLKLAQTDPARFAQETGLKLADLANQTLKPDEFNLKKQNVELADRLKKLEEMNTKAQEDATIRKQQDDANKYISNLTNNINNAKDKYPVVNEYGEGAVKLIINTIATHYQNSGEELNWEEATQLTEDYLANEKIQDINRLLKLEKIRSKLDLPKPTEPTKEVKQAKISTTGISNRTASAPAVKEVGKTTKEERQRRINELAQTLYKE